jgi:hypothetical protein
MHDSARDANRLSWNVRRVGRLDLPGAGQVTVQGTTAYVGHMKPPHGTSILDVSDPARPRLLTTIELADPYSHTHKVRVVGDRMVVNVEQNNRHFLRKGSRIPEATARLTASLGRPPTEAELAAALQVAEADLPTLREAQARGYRDGGFRVYDVADPRRPRLLATQRTGGIGVHRFDLDERYAYISTEMDGYVGNILVIYDLADPRRPAEVSRWWLPGQHLAGGETPTWTGTTHRLHHALRHGDQLWAAYWYAGFFVLDVSDMARPRAVAGYNYHPPYPEPTHTALRVPFPVGGRQIALVVDEEHEHTRGQPHAGLWLFDVADRAAIRPLSLFEVSEMDSPWSRAGGRFGAHQFQERLEDTLVYAAWFAGGLRVVDIADPLHPAEVGFFIPEPAAGQQSPQSNDVAVDDRGLIYLADRNRGLDILEFRRP